MISSFYKHDFLHSQNTLSSELRNIEKHSRTISETIYTYIYIYSNQVFEIKLTIFIITFYIPKKNFFYVYPIKINIPLHLHKKMVNINRLLKEYPSTLLEEISVFAKMPFLCKLPLVRGKSDG